MLSKRPTSSEMCQEDIWYSYLSFSNVRADGIMSGYFGSLLLTTTSTAATTTTTTSTAVCSSLWREESPGDPC